MRMSEADLASRFPQMRPVASPPSLESVVGTGFGLIGRRDHDPATDSIVKTRVLRLFFVPLAALDAYRVSAAPEGGWYVLGREPLSGAARVWNTLLVLGLVGIGGLAAKQFLTVSESARALAQLDRADRHRATGEVEQAALLYAEVARGGTEHAETAAQKFDELLGEPLDEAPLSAAAGVLRVAANWAEDGRFQELVAPRGLELLSKHGADDPGGVVAVLEVVQPQAEDGKAFDARVRPLLEAWVKRHREDARLATALARVYERGGEVDRAGELLMPYRDRLGSSEGARILGQRLARKGEFEQALPLLEAYVRAMGPHIEAAERHYDRSVERLRRSIRQRVEQGQAEGFPYRKFEKAGPAEQERIYTEYETAQLRDSPERRRASQRLNQLGPAVLAVL